MSPIAILSPTGLSPRPSSVFKPPTTASISFSGADTIPRRPSPWHDLAHSLSETTLPHATEAGAPLGSSIGRRYSSQSSPILRHATSSESLSLGVERGTVPKLAAERDKDGHIEYKLKLIDPTPERFERLVTQMLWRLKQGRNEAIYELGLADDGTVIGLTRAEMDASLRTLELMASDVGATVIILKEIILTCPPPPPSTSAIRTVPPPRTTYRGDLSERTPDLSASTSSRASSAHLSDVGSADGPLGVGASPSVEPQQLTDKDAAAWTWPVRRPDLDTEGNPRATGGLKLRKKKSKRHMRKKRHPGCGGELDSNINGAQAYLPADPGGAGEDDADEDIPPFHLDMDDGPASPKAETSKHPMYGAGGVLWKEGWDASSRGGHAQGGAGSAGLTHSSAESNPKRSWGRSQKLPTASTSVASPSPAASPGAVSNANIKSAQRLAKAAARREQRRMDLLRGDGLGWGGPDDLGVHDAAIGHDPILPISPTSRTFPFTPTSPSALDRHEHRTTPTKPSSSLPSSPADARYDTCGRTPPAIVPIIPHKPARPSSLRLTTPAPAPSPACASAETASLGDECLPAQLPEEAHMGVSSSDTFLAELLRIPLDNLSLSFAEVRTVTDPSELLRDVVSGEGSRRGRRYSGSSRAAGTDESPTSDVGLNLDTESETEHKAEVFSSPRALRTVVANTEALEGNCGDVLSVDSATRLVCPRAISSPSPSPHLAAVPSLSGTASHAALASANCVADGRAPSYMGSQPASTPSAIEALALASDPTVPDGWREMICVEALVVRKTAEGVAGVEEWCEGGEDGWGFGFGDGDGDGEVEGHVGDEEYADDDGWGF